jgi:hypothetical protein
MPDLFTKPVEEITYEDLETFAHTEPIEGERLDWKEELTPRTAETIAAMANTEGGLILVGAAEREVAGQRTKQLAWPPRRGVTVGVRDALASICQSAYRPPDYLPRSKLVPIKAREGEHVLVIRIDQRSAPRWVWHRERGFLVRTADQNRPATPERIAQLLSEAQVNSEADDIATTWGMISPPTDGVEQMLIAVMQYPHGATVFGQHQKDALVEAVQSWPGYRGPLQIRPGYRDIAMVRNMRAAGDASHRLEIWFHAAGVARVCHVGRFGAIPWRWVVGEIMLTMNCLRGKESTDVYPNVREGTLRLALTNWPVEGVALDDPLQATCLSTQTLCGLTVTHDFQVDPEMTPWDVARSFMDRVLADSGHWEYERSLDLLGAQASEWLAEYARAGQLRGQS